MRRIQEISTRVAVAAAVIAIVVAVVAVPGQARERHDSTLAARSPVVSESSTATVECGFRHVGDLVHVSSGGATAHGWWQNRNCPISRADVRVQLQVKIDGSWRDVGESDTVLARAGREVRAQAKVPCKDSTRTEWRSVIDVDVPDHSDGRDQLFTPPRKLGCCP